MSDPASLVNAASALPLKIVGSHMLPELVGSRGVVAFEDGHRRMLVDRMRVIARSDGSIERATELFPPGNVAAVALPTRLGSGFLFHVTSAGSTEIWRASTWLSALVPLARRSEAVSEIIPGFDRVYLRFASANRLVALDPSTGEPMGLGALPLSSSYGMLAFADGWRAIVDTDLRGPLTTFDAGSTWRPLALTERPTAVGVVDGDPIVIVNGGRYQVSARGAVTYRSDPGSSGAPRDDADPALHPHGPLGNSPLRTAIEDGFPDGPSTAVVARGGALARVSLTDGMVQTLVDDAYAEHRSTCHAVRLGLRGVGFVCGESGGPTVVYEYVAPLAMRPVLRFSKPRFVSASGTGALVVRGTCDDDPSLEGEDDGRPYCIISPLGKKRDLRVKGDLGTERVVGLGDGRIAVLVPPRTGHAGAITVVTATGTTNATLTLPDASDASLHELKRGLWLDGFEERRPGVIGGWVEAGGPVVGVEVSLDGKVMTGPVRDDPGGAVFGGRFAITMLGGGRAAETTDGGKTWTKFDLPDRPEEARSLRTRSCGPVGAALPGWVRVGWGDSVTPNDLKQAEGPGMSLVPPRLTRALAFACSVDTTTTPPLPDKPRPTVVSPAVRKRVSAARGVTSLAAPPKAGTEMFTAWPSFRNTVPPTIADGDYGVDNGTGSDLVQLRVYAWGKRGADWTRAGRWITRFDDRFDPAGGVRSTALTASPWADEALATEALASGGSYGQVQWSGFLDPSGRAVLASGCRGSVCSLYSVVEGAPVLPIRDSTGRTAAFQRPLGFGAVHVGESWFFLTATGSYEAVALWRVDLGVARVIGTYHRPTHRSSYESPRLVRRASSGHVGLLIAGAPEPGERTGDWYVLPANPDTGELGEAVSLGRRDLVGVVRPGFPLVSCARGQDGWMVETSVDLSPILDIDNARSALEPLELRLRLDPGVACVDAMAARSGPFFPIQASTTAGRAPARAITTPPGHARPSNDWGIPLAVTEKATGRRWGLTCRFNPAH